MSNIYKQRDFDDQFFRMVGVALAKTMSQRIRWINRFENGYRRTVMPFYLDLVGDEQFVMDAFVDDIVDQRVILNTDQKQRGVIKMTSINSKSDELANPNQYLAQKGNINGKLRKILSKVKAVPVTIGYDIKIQLDTKNEIDKCSQKILDMFFNYFFFNIDYYGIKVDAVLLLPDDKGIEVPEEISLESETKKMITFSLNVETYYPIFQIALDDLIVCENDDDIDWDYLEVARPTSEFNNSVKNYNDSINQTNYIGAESGSTEKEGLTEIRKVYWSNYFQQYDTIINRSHDPRTWSKEDFSGIPVISGATSEEDNDL